MRNKPLYLAIVIMLAVSLKSHADTVYLKNGGLKKGMVVEDYVDRIIFSTIDGETVIMKEEIEKIGYDDPELNLMSLGDAAMQNGRYKLAYKYYTLGLSVNPALDILRKKADHANLLIYKEKELSKREMIEKKAMLEADRMPVFQTAEPQELIEKEFGIVLKRTENGSFRMDGMKQNSPFRKAGFKVGDYIVSVWSKLTSYLTLKEMAELLKAQDQHIIEAVLERRLELVREPGAPLGATFGMEYDGMVVKSVISDSPAGKAGLSEGDLLVEVNGSPIRYVKMGEVLKMLEENKKSEIAIRRARTVFKIKE